MLDEGQSPLLTRPRRAALEALNLLGIPPKGPGNGDRYHYTDLRGVFGEEWEHYFTPSHPGVAPDDLPGQMHRMKFLNGFCCDARHLTRLADGVVFGSLAAAAREYPGLVGKYYNTLPDGRGSAVAELTAAFVQDGAFVYVPRGFVSSFRLRSSAASTATAKRSHRLGGTSLFSKREARRSS